MQEKFHQFNRQDNPKIIEEGLVDMELETKPQIEDETSLKEDLIESNAVESQKNPENSMITDEEKTALFSRLKKPRDILGLPSFLRREGLATLREKIADRYLSISKLEIAIFDFLDQIDIKNVNEETLRIDIKAKVGEYELNDEDRQIIDQLLDHFFRNLKKMKEIIDLSKLELLAKLIKNPDFLPQITGEYDVKVTPYAVHFNFDRIEDFRLFISGNEGEVKEEFKDTYGLSFSNKGFPITASGYKPDSKATFNHEIQHKKFLAINMDKILTKEKAEWDTRNEILARFSERGESTDIFYIVLSYGFAEKYNVDKTLYKQTLRNAVDSIQKLQLLKFTKDEIIGLISKEKLTTWPKIVERIRNSKTGMDIFQQRRRRRVKINKNKI